MSIYNLCPPKTTTIPSTPNVFLPNDTANFQASTVYLHAPTSSKPVMSAYVPASGVVPIVQNQVVTTAPTPVMGSLAPSHQYPTLGAGSTSVSYGNTSYAATVGQNQTSQQQSSQIPNVTSVIQGGTLSSVRNADVNVNFPAPKSSNSALSALRNISVPVQAQVDTLTMTDSIVSPTVNGNSGLTTVGAAAGHSLACSSQGLCGGPSTQYGFATPNMANGPSVPGVAGASIPAVTALTETPQNPNLTLAAGLQFGLNPAQPYVPAAIQGGINPPMSVMGTDLSTIVTNAEPWYTGRFLSQPAAVLHDNNPCNRSTTILHRALDGAPILTTIVPDENGCPIVKSMMPTKCHPEGCCCEECTEYCLDECCINGINGVSGQFIYSDYNTQTYTFSSLLNPYTFIFEIMPASGHPLENRIPTDIALSVNGVLGRTLFLRRGYNYTFQFTMSSEFANKHDSTSDIRKLADNSKLIFTFDPVGGPMDFPGTPYGKGQPVLPSKPSAQSGFPLEGKSKSSKASYSFTVGDTISDNVNREFILYYQLDNTPFAGGVIVVLPEEC